MRRKSANQVVGILIVASAFGGSAAVRQPPPSLSDRPDTPFKLATFEAQGRVRLGLVAGAQVFDIAGANTYVARQAALPAVEIPADMRGLIEQYDVVSKRLYQIANYLKDKNVDGQAFAFRADRVSFKAPIKYPWNLLAAAANYRSHAAEMFTPSGPGQAAPAGNAGPAGGAPNPNAVDPDKEDPVMFAKSPRSCIIDPGEPYFMPAGRNIDWEGELAIIMGKPALNVSEAQAHDYVFGYSIMYDVSDRGGTGMRPLTSMFQGPSWFRGKSRDRAAPFGPVIVPKEFIPDYRNLRIVTRVNGVVKQDGNTKDLIWNEGHLVRFLSSILTLYPGDVISTGTPDGVGTARRPPEYLKPGDVVTIEIDRIGTLTTPMKAAASPN